MEKPLEDTRRDYEREEKCDMSMQNGEGDSHKIYEYLKKNPGLCVKLGATCIAILSALIAFCGYIYESAIAQYWEIDPVYLDLSTTNYLYSSII